MQTSSPRARIGLADFAKRDSEAGLTSLHRSMREIHEPLLSVPGGDRRTMSRASANTKKAEPSRRVIMGGLTGRTPREGTIIIENPSEAVFLLKIVSGASLGALLAKFCIQSSRHDFSKFSRIFWGPPPTQPLTLVPGLFSRKWGVLTPLVRPPRGLPSRPRASGAFLWVHTTRS